LDELTPLNLSTMARLPFDTVKLDRTLAAGVSEALDKLLLRCLHPRRELRFGSADEVLQELKGMVRIV